MTDMVNNPPHYTNGAIECIDAIRSALTPEEFRGYCKATIIAYVWRERFKGGDEDLKKACWYLDALIGKELARDGIVRCRDCENLNIVGKCPCGFWALENLNGFCAWGKRKEGGE